MRRTVFLLAFLAFIASGCGKNDSSPSLTMADLPVPDSEMLLMAEAMPKLPSLTTAEICQLALTDDENLEEYCRVLGGGWIEIEGEFYCPGAVYPRASWNPETVLNSYFERTAPWVPDAEGLVLWSHDYVHKFAVTDDWFLVDGVRVTPLVEETHDILPFQMVKAYQSGKWDGEKWYSEGYSTYVTIDYNTGKLLYHYDVINYGRENDPLSIGFDDYDEPPAFFQHFEEDVTKTGPVEIEFTMLLFLDLPLNKSGFFQACYCGVDGTYLLVEDGIEQYKRGQLVKKWKIKLSQDAVLRTDTVIGGQNGIAYVCADNVLYRLLENGSVEKVFEDVTEAKCVNDKGADGFYITLTQGDKLFCCELFSGSVEEIDTDVLIAMECGGAVFYIKNTDEIYILNPEQLPYTNESSYYLGRGKVTEYMTVFFHFDGEFEEFIAKYDYGSPKRSNPGG